QAIESGWVISATSAPLALTVPAMRARLAALLSPAHSSGRVSTGARAAPAGLGIKCLAQPEIVTGGSTEPEGSRVGIGALLGGVYEDGPLVYIGKSGTGFDTRTLRDLKARLTRLAQKTNPFAARPPGS